MSIFYLFFLGESSHLSIYNIETSDHILRKKIFSTAEIHGIKHYNNKKEEHMPKFLIWGQKYFSFALVNLQNLTW